MKKIVLAIILASLMVFSLAACENQSTSVGTSAETRDTDQDDVETSLEKIDSRAWQ